MKTNVNIERLRTFAESLSQIKRHREHGLFRTVIVYAIEDKVRIHLEVKCHHWVFDHLVEVFPEEWGWHAKTGDPVLDAEELVNPDVNTADCVCQFFEIDDYEIFCHLFDLEGHQQIDRFGGQKLSEESSGPDISGNMFALIEKLGC